MTFIMIIINPVDFNMGCGIRTFSFVLPLEFFPL